MLDYQYVPPELFFAQIEISGAIALDLETHLITPTNKAPKPVVMSLARRTPSGSTLATLVPYSEMGDYISRLLEFGGWLAGANIPFDFGVIAQWGCPSLLKKFRDRHFDVQVHERLLQIQSGDLSFKHLPVSLGALSSRYLKHELDKSDWRLRYAELEGVPISSWPLGAVTYALEDAVATLLIHQEQWTKNPLQPDELSFQQRAALELHAISVRGIEVDGGLVEELDERWSKEVAELKEYLRVGGLAGPKGRLQLASIRRRVETALGARAPRTAKGMVSTSADTLRQTGDPDLLKVVELKKVQKLTTTYMPFMREKSVHCGRWGIADTGRTTSSDPNLQNLPKRGLGAAIRPAFIARPGFVFVEADYPSCELRCLAHICYEKFGKSNLRDMLNARKDPATWLAAAMGGVDPYVLQDEIDGGSPLAKDARQRAKMGIYGFPGGMGIDRFISTARVQSEGKVIFTPQEVSALREQWHLMFPEMAEYFKWIKSHEGAGGLYLMRAWGSERWRGGMRYTEAANSQFQGLAADIGKGALLRMGQFIRDHHDRGGLVGYVHDSILWEVEVELSPGADRILAREMEIAALERASSVTWPIVATVSERWL